MQRFPYAAHLDRKLLGESCPEVKQAVAVSTLMRHEDAPPFFHPNPVTAGRPYILVSGLIEMASGDVSGFSMARPIFGQRELLEESLSRSASEMLDAAIHGAGRCDAITERDRHEWEMWASASVEDTIHTMTVSGAAYSLPDLVRERSGGVNQIIEANNRFASGLNQDIYQPLLQLPSSDYETYNFIAAGGDTAKRQQRLKTLESIPLAFPIWRVQGRAPIEGPAPVSDRGIASTLQVMFPGLQPRMPWPDAPPIALGMPARFGWEYMASGMKALATTRQSPNPMREISAAIDRLDQTSRYLRHYECREQREAAAQLAVETRLSPAMILQRVRDPDSVNAPEALTTGNAIRLRYAAGGM